MANRYQPVPFTLLLSLLFVSVTRRNVLSDAKAQRTSSSTAQNTPREHPCAGGVDVRLGSGTERRFDLLIGADGLHSITRKLIFSNSEQSVRQLGMYVGTLAIPELDLDTMAVQLYNAPGRLVAIHPGRATPGAAFISGTMRFVILISAIPGTIES